MVHGFYTINQDIGRHIKTGEIIWQTRTIPKTNLFSFTLPDHLFINHHWFSEVIFYLLNLLIGLRGLIVFKVFVNVVAFLFVYLAVRKRASVWAIIPIFVLSALIFIERTDVRPEIFSYLCIAYYLFAIFKSKYESAHRWLYALPFIQIFWTNAHIYFVLGPMLLFFYLIDRFMEYKLNTSSDYNGSLLSFLPAQTGKDSHCNRLILIISALVVLSTLINPNFIRGAIAPFNILTDYGYSIIENQNIFFLANYGISKFTINAFELSAIVLIMSFIVALRHGARKLTFEILTGIAFIILAGKMIRNLGPYTFVFASIASANFGYIKKEISNKVTILLSSVAVILLAWLSYSVYDGSFYSFIGNYKHFELAVPSGAEGAINFIKQNNIKGPVFNNFDIGSYMIWKMWPDEKVFVDGRPEAYGQEFFDKIYKPMQQDPAVWARLSEQYNINYILFAYTDITPWAQTFLNRISKDKNWPMVYLDNNSVIFLKNTPANRAIIAKNHISPSR
jgi:hypothetical protein